MIKNISYSEYREKSLGLNIDMRPAETIIAEIEELHRKEFGECEE